MTMRCNICGKKIMFTNIRSYNGTPSIEDICLCKEEDKPMEEQSTKLIDIDINDLGSGSYTEGDRREEFKDIALHLLNGIVTNSPIYTKKDDIVRHAKEAITVAMITAELFINALDEHFKVSSE